MRLKIIGRFGIYFTLLAAALTGCHIKNQVKNTHNPVVTIHCLSSTEVEINGKRMGISELYFRLKEMRSDLDLQDRLVRIHLVLFKDAEKFYDISSILNEIADAGETNIYLLPHEKSSPISLPLPSAGGTYLLIPFRGRAVSIQKEDIVDQTLNDPAIHLPAHKKVCRINIHPEDKILLYSKLAEEYEAKGTAFYASLFKNSDDVK